MDTIWKTILWQQFGAAIDSRLIWCMAARSAGRPAQQSHGFTRQVFSSEAATQRGRHLSEKNGRCDDRFAILARCRHPTATRVMAGFVGVKHRGADARVDHRPTLAPLLVD